METTITRPNQASTRSKGGHMAEHEIMLFKNQAFGEIRTIIVNSEPWFVASDVAKSLGYANSSVAVRDNCKHAELFKTNQKLVLELGPRGVLIIPESDVYRLIMRSNLPGAESFQDWVVEEVLPSIRKHGAYMTPATVDEIIANPEAAINILSALVAERKKNDAIQAECSRLKELNSGYEHEFWNDSQKRVYVNSFQTARSVLTVNQTANMLRQQTGADIGGKRLFQWMRNQGWVCKNKLYNREPTSMAINQCLLQVRYIPYESGFGKRCYRQTVVTKKGQDHLLHFFLNGRFY